MPSKPLSVISLVLLIPVALLVLFAVRSLSLENDALNARRDRLAKQRMVTAAAHLNAKLEDLGRDVLTQTQTAYDTQGPEALTEGARKRRYIYAFVFKQGTVLHSVTALEHQYDRARGVQDSAQALAKTVTTPGQTEAALVQTGSAYVLMRCSMSASEEVVCVAIHNLEVSNALRSALDAVVRTSGLIRAGLVAPNKTEIKLAGTDAISTSSFALDGLLQDWQLHGEDHPADNQTQNTLLLYLIGSSLIAGWVVVTWSLYRSAVLKEEAGVVRAGVIAQLAHELRTPLANLRLHTELLSRKASDAPAVQRYATILQSEIERLSNVAENAIVVARGGMTKPKLESAVPDDCLNDILERYEPTIAAAGCRLRILAGAATACRFDRTAWERCVVNLIDNARKYAPGTEIEISTSQTASVLRLVVSDRGPGVPADQVQQIFEALARGLPNGASGFGLGLAAVRALARQNGGDCWVENNNPGARFVLTMNAIAADTH